MPIGSEAFKEAVRLLRRGALVALPTETVYGLAGDAANDAAIARIYELKGRPAHNPLIAHVLSPEDVATFAEVNPLAQSLMEAFWPGPLTLVLPRKQRASNSASDEAARLSSLAGGWLPTLAVRCPDTLWSKAFLELGWRGALFMPSANISGRISPTRASHVSADFEQGVDLIIDGGPCQAGVESTVLEVKDDYAVLLRPGAISAQQLAPYIDDLRAVDAAKTDDLTPNAPGMLKSHYAPRARVRLNAHRRQSGEVLLGFGEIEGDLNLSPAGDLTEAARNLYAYLRRLDERDASCIAVAPVPHEGLGAAINDRLNRAAAER